eukprot:2448674-Pyramimonas_sp.AAC.1
MAHAPITSMRSCGCNSGEQSRTSRRMRSRLTGYRRICFRRKLWICRSPSGLLARQQAGGLLCDV